MDPTGVTVLIAAAEKIPYLGPALVVLIPLGSFIIAVCSAIATKLPAPLTTTGVYYWIYTVVNWGALAFGHAVSLAAPASSGIVGGPSAITAPQVSVASVPLATAEAFPPDLSRYGTPPVPSIPVLPISVPPVNK
jgi:hypothetical protein